MDAERTKKAPDYEANALRALSRARKAMNAEDGDSQEAQYQLAAANVYASLELASALKSGNS